MFSTSTRNLAEVQRSTPSFVAAGATDHSIHFDRVINQMPSTLAAASGPIAAASPAATSARGLPRALTPTQSSRAKSPSASVHESLLERGKLYEQRKEALREKSVRRELARCRSVPKISRMGHDIERPSDIKDRLMAVFQERQKVKEFETIIATKKEDEIMERWFQPHISHKGRRAQGRTKSKKQQHETWEYKRQQRLEALRREKILKEMQDLHGAPDIDPRSQVLAARRREREGLAGYTHIEAMLERDRLSRLARWEDQQRQQALLAQAASPKITEFAASLNRGDDVAERLQREAEARERRRQERERQYFDEQAGKGKSGPAGGSFDPDSLVERHAVYMQRRDEKIRSIQEAEKALHTPAIDPVSEKLAARLPMSPMERLVQPRARTPTSRVSSINGGPSEAQSSPRSSRPAVTESDVQAYERLQLAEARRKLRVEAARAEQAKRQLDECTFRPQTTTHYYEGREANGGSNTTAGSDAAAVYSRSQEWQQRRLDKLEEQRRQRAEQEREAHPFAPAVVGLGPVPSGDASAGDVSGFSSFLARQQMARNRRHAESDAAPQSPVTPRRPVGADGRPLQTVPVAPALGRERDPAQVPVVLSLVRPVEPPSLGYATYIAPRDSGPGHAHHPGASADDAGHLAHELLHLPQSLSGSRGANGRADDAISFGSEDES
jgi:hypothetical protein